MLKCPKCGSGNIIVDRFSETGERCLMCGTEPALSPMTAVPFRKKTNITKEESMSRGKDYPCPDECRNRGRIYRITKCLSN